jgi:phosphate transport system permease protein
MPLEPSPAATSASGSTSAAVIPDATMRSTTKRWHETLLYWIFVLCASISVLTTVGIIYVLIHESIPFFNVESVGRFLTGTVWEPDFSGGTDGKYGVLPLVCGTFLVTLGAAFFALPLGLMAAIYLSEYATPKARSILKPVLELLAGVPSVVYGFFALTSITPVLQGLAGIFSPLAAKILPGTPFEISIYNALSASIAVAIMTLPLVSSLCEDALHVVPRSLREGAYALGATKMEVSVQVVVPAALSGIGAAFILAISRAIGETMIVTLAAGSLASLTLNPFESVQTMTAYIAQTFMGEAQHGTVGYQSIFAVGLLLFSITVAMNLLSMALVKKYRQKYD